MTDKTGDVYQVSMVMNVTKNGVPFSKTEQTYDNMSKEQVHATESAVVGALLSLGD